MRSKFRLAPMIVLAPILLLGVACGDDDENGAAGGADSGPGAGAIEPTWSWVQDEVLVYCDGDVCHGADNEAQLVDLSRENAYGNLVGVPSTQLPVLAYVSPGDPDGSYLYLKLEGTHGDACEAEGIAAADCGVQMPFDELPLGSDALAAVYQWIADGALQE